LFLESTPHSFGIKAKDGLFEKIMDRNTAIPNKRSRVFSFQMKNVDNQDTLGIHIFEGEKDIAEENGYIGTLEIKRIPKLTRGSFQIEFTIDIDANSTILVSAKDCG